MRYLRRTLARALLVTALACGAAQAAPVIVVDGSSAQRVEDPSVPTRAEIALGAPEGGGEAPGLAGAASARTRARSARSASSWRQARAAAGRRKARRAVYRALGRAVAKDEIASSDRRRWRRWYLRGVRALRALRSARDAQLRYVVDSVEALALGGLLSPTRMPAAFLQIERNRQYWRRLPYPAAGDQISFRGSQILFQYFPGEGLQLHPLATFKKANALHGFCVREEAECDPDALRGLLDEMNALGVARGRRFVAWEYLFHFGGGAPPWMSGMAQATGIQALGRASDLLGEPGYRTAANRALGAFSARPPRGVRTRGPGGGVHYLQYSFAPRLYIFNAFLQSLIGLYDYFKLTGNERAHRLFLRAEPEARAEVPLSDVGDWSRYSYAGAESTSDYHELLREFLASMCSRRLGAFYCDYSRRYRGYQVDPPVLRFLGPDLAAPDEWTSIRFSVSKLSAVEVEVYKGDRLAFERLATFRRGNGSFAWRPRSPGLYRVRLAAKELRTGLGKRDRVTGEIAVE
jgi:hypothetical protein